MSDLNIILSYVILPLSIIYLTDKLIEYLINKKVRTYPIKKILIPLIITITIFISTYSFIIVIGTVILSTIYLFIYSYLEYRKEV